jgi:two-component system phosphate regulon response regulator PhoB
VVAVDDDPQVLALLSRALTREGFQVTAVRRAADALELIGRDPPDLLLLDVNLGKRDGFGVLTEIRGRLDLPVILVTGRGEEQDRVLGLRLGADDYVVKPFSPQELVARIDTILHRRVRTRRAASRPEVRTFGELGIDTGSREVRVDGATVQLTAKEFDLLTFLSASPRQVFTREQLLRGVWSSSGEWQDVATVTEHVRRLRGKIERSPSRPRWVVTVRGIGYRFEP